MNQSLLRKQLDARSERFGFKTASYLSEGTSALPHDISERLRAARVQAVANRKILRAEPVLAGSSLGGSSVLTLGSGGKMGWFSRLGSVVPLVVLVLGVLTINSIQSERRAEELAEVDAALLTDDLPPAAFTDPGFVQFLKSDR
jgi:Protein of unknown function (DUF3619)